MHRNPNQRALIIKSVESTFNPCPAITPQEGIDNGEAQPLPKGYMCHDLSTNVTIEYYPYRFKEAIVDMIVTEYFEEHLITSGVEFEPKYPVPEVVQTGLTLEIPGVAGEEMGEEDTEWLIEFMQDFLGEFLAQNDPPIKLENVIFVGQSISAESEDTEGEDGRTSRALYNDSVNPILAMPRLLNATNATTTSTLIVSVIVEAEYLPPPYIDSFSDVVVETITEEDDAFVEQIQEIEFFENVTEITASAPPIPEVVSSTSEQELLSKPVQISLIIASWCILWSVICYLLYIKLMDRHIDAKKKWRQSMRPDGVENSDESLDGNDVLLSSDPYSICADNEFPKGREESKLVADLKQLQIATGTENKMMGTIKKRPMGRRSQGGTWLANKVIYEEEGDEEESDSSSSV